MEDFEKIIVDGVCVLAVNLIRSTVNEVIAFREVVEEVINSRHSNFVFDLSQCEFIDSTFFGAIIISLKTINAKGYNLKIVEPAKTGENVFTAINFRRLFDLYKTREDAIKSFEDVY